MSNRERKGLPVVCDPGPEYADTRQVQGAAGRAAKTVTAWIKAGLLVPVARTPATKRSKGRVLYLVADVERVSREQGCHPRTARAMAQKRAGKKGRPLDPHPCPHPPGSEGRIETYRRRVEQGYEIWHQLDGKGDE